MTHPNAFARLGAGARRLLATADARRALAALLVGAVAFAVLGDTPVSQRAPDPGRGAFTLPPAPTAPDAAVGALAAAPVWASQPAVAAEKPDIAPPPRLVGVVGTGGSAAVALFEWPDGRRSRVLEGATLEGEGQVQAITTTRVRWRRADGTLVESLLFQNPEPRVIPPDAPK